MRFAYSLCYTINKQMFFSDKNICFKKYYMSKLILLIDDDEDEEYIFKEALNEANTSCKCIYIQNAERAIEVLNTVLPDFIFIDIKQLLIYLM